MADKVLTSNNLINDLVRQIFYVEPDVMAAVAHADAQVRLRRPSECRKPRTRWTAWGVC
jgi:hypothetical protein